MYQRYATVTWFCELFLRFAFRQSLIIECSRISINLSRLPNGLRKNGLVRIFIVRFWVQPD